MNKISKNGLSLSWFAIVVIAVIATAGIIAAVKSTVGDTIAVEAKEKVKDEATRQVSRQLHSIRQDFEDMKKNYKALDSAQKAEYAELKKKYLELKDSTKSTEGSLADSLIIEIALLKKDIDSLSKTAQKTSHSRADSVMEKNEKIEKKVSDSPDDAKSSGKEKIKILERDIELWFTDFVELKEGDVFKNACSLEDRAKSLAGMYGEKMVLTEMNTDNLSFVAWNCYVDWVDIDGEWSTLKDMLDLQLPQESVAVYQKIEDVGKLPTWFFILRNL